MQGQDWQAEVSDAACKKVVEDLRADKHVSLGACLNEVLAFVGGVGAFAQSIWVLLGVWR